MLDRSIVYVWFNLFIFSPTKHSKLDVLTNVKNQFGGWVGSVSIPKFRKNEGEAHSETVAADAKAPEEDPAQLEKPAKTGEEKDEDDNSR